MMEILKKFGYASVMVLLMFVVISFVSQGLFAQQKAADPGRYPHWDILQNYLENGEMDLAHKNLVNATGDTLTLHLVVIDSIVFDSTALKFEYSDDSTWVIINYGGQEYFAKNDSTTY